MATITGSGVSIKLDSYAAGREAAQSAYYQLGRNNPDIIFAFISTIFDQREALRGIRSVIGQAPLIGCSSAGSITQQKALRGSVSIFAIHSGSISFSLGVGKPVSKNSRLAGLEAAKQAHSNSSKHKTTKAYIMFSDALSGNGADILRGTQEVLGTSFPIIGGAASDEGNFQKTYQYLNDNIYTNSVVGVLISGNINVGIGKAHGWQPIGKPHRVTRARSNIIREIDRRVAVEIYEEYFGKSFEELKNIGIGKLGSSYPLGVRTKGNDEHLIRSPIKVEDNGSLVLTAEIREGEDVNLMIGDKNLALDATRAACLDAAKDIQRQNIKFITVFNDIARYNLLRKDSQKEIDTVKDIFGENIPITGFYAYGEYASLYAHEYRDWSNFQNQAFSIATFSE